MKMSDVFVLPVTPNRGGSQSNVGWMLASDEEVMASAHAINCHDGLVDVLQMAIALIKANAIDNPECTFSHNLAMRACDELHRAKGE